MKLFIEQETNWPLSLEVLREVRVKLQLAGQWMAVQPRNTGQQWNIQIQITPVIPKLIKGTLFE